MPGSPSVLALTLLPAQKVAILPEAGQEAQARWVCLQDAPLVPGISWAIRTLQPPPEQEHPQYSECPGWGGLGQVPLPRPSSDTPHPTSAGGLDFDAILLRPSEVPANQKPPLVVMPHGESLPCTLLCPRPRGAALTPLCLHRSQGVPTPSSRPGGCCSQRRSAAWASQCCWVSDAGALGLLGGTVPAVGPGWGEEGL